MSDFESQSVKTLSTLSTGCGCSKASKRVAIALPGCTNDAAAVAILPDDWTPKHSGSTLAYYLNKREENHDKIIKEFSSQTCRVNNDIDAKVREIAEILMTQIQDNQAEVDCIVQNCGTGEEEFTPEQRKTTLNQIQKIFASRLKNIAEFRENALKLERERADGIRALMRDNFQQLVEVGHKIPKDLLYDFDDRIYEVNQQLLSNTRAYNELEAQFHSEADENAVKARSTLNQLCLGVRTAYRCQSARSSSRITSVGARSSSAVENRRLSEPIQVIYNVQEQLADCAAHLLEAYRYTVRSILSGFSGKLHDLHQALINLNFDEIANNQHIKSGENLEAVFVKLLRRISASFQSKIQVLQKNQEAVVFTENEVVCIQKSLKSLGECLRDTYTILHDTGHLWDDHMLRSALGQKLTIAAVEDLLTHHDSVEQANEINFNQVLEQMTTSADEEKLNAMYATLLMLLATTAEMYERHTSAEIGRLEEFMNLPPVMANVLLAEFQCFLTKHPRITIDPSKSRNSDASNTNISQLSPLFSLIKQTEFQEQSLMNWRNGFLETFENNVISVPEELNNQAQMWVNERLTALNMRSSLKKASYSIRKERVKVAYESRLVEIRHHESRLQSHINAINQLIATLPEEASQFAALDSPELYPISVWLGHIDKEIQKVVADPDVNQEVRTLKMKSYAPRLARYRELFEESLAAHSRNFMSHMEYLIQNARISNVRFIDRVILFSDGGTYSCQEASKISTALLKTADLLDACETRIQEALNNRRLQLSALAEQECLPLQKITGEFVKAKNATGGSGGGGSKAKGKKK